MKSITKRIISTLFICGALVLEAGATAIGSLGKALNNIAKVDAADSSASVELCTSWNKNLAYTTGYTQDYTINNLSGGTTKMTLGVKGVYRQSNANTYFQMNKKDGYFKNTTKLPGKITKIETTWSAAKGPTKCYFAAAAQASSSDSTITITASTSVTYTPDNKDDYYYFNIDTSTGSGSAQMTSCVVYYETASKPVGDTYNIAFNGGEASGSKENEKNAINAAYPVPDSEGFITPTGKVFDYWSGSDGGTYYIGESVPADTMTKDSTLTLTAHWKDLPKKPTDVTEIALTSVNQVVRPSGSTDTTQNAYKAGTGKSPSFTYTVSGIPARANKLVLYTAAWGADTGDTVTISSTYSDENSQTAIKDAGIAGSAEFTLTKASIWDDIYRVEFDLKNITTTVNIEVSFGYRGAIWYSGYTLAEKTNVQISGDNVSMSVGDPDVSPENVNVEGYTLISNNTSIVTIANNKIHAVSAGDTTVTISKEADDLHTYTSCNINVSVSAKLEPYITPDETSVTGYTGENKTVGVSYGNLAGTLSVSSSDASVGASISPTTAGRADLALSFVSEGSAVISLKDGDDTLATISVSSDLSKVTITGLPGTADGYIGRTTDLGTLITVSAVGTCTDDVTWSSGSSSIATVDENGVVKGVSKGTVEITVTPDDYEAGAVSCFVTIAEAPLDTTYDFTTNFATYASEWSNSYGTHDGLKGDDDIGGDYAATINLYQVSKQTGTITDKPVFANKNAADSFDKIIDFTLDESSYYIVEIGVTFEQWASKTPDVQLSVGDKIVDSGTIGTKNTLSTTLDAGDECTKFSVNYCGHATGSKPSNVQAGLTSIYIKIAKAKALDSIDVSFKSDAQRTLENGSNFSFNGTVTAYYDDGTDDTVSSSLRFYKDSIDEENEIDNSTTITMDDDQATIFVTYTENGVTKDDSYTLIVKYSDVTSVILSKSADSVIKENDYDLSEITVTINPETALQEYEWSIKDASEVSGDCSLVGETFTAGTTTGDVTLACTAGDQSAVFVITVINEPVPQLIDFVTDGSNPLHPIQYRNDSFELDLTGVVITGKYDLAKPDPETFGKDDFTWNNEGDHPIGTFIDDTSLSVTLDIISLVDDYLRGIEFTSDCDMTKKEYYVGEDWDFSGLSAKGIWASGDKSDVTATFTTEDTTEVAGTKSIDVTAHYTPEGGTELTAGKTIEGITINNDVIVSISAEYTGEAPILGEDFEFVGNLTANMESGGTSPLTTDDVVIGDVDKYTLDVQTITVTLKNTDITTTFTVQYQKFSGSYYSRTTSLTIGDTVTLYAPYVKQVLTGFSTSSTVFGTAGTANLNEDGKLVFDEGVIPQDMVVCDGYQDGTYSFKIGESKYLKWSSGNSLTSAGTKVEANTSWKIAFDGETGHATIINCVQDSGSDRVILWNYSNPRFACYKGQNPKDGTSGYGFVDIFKKNADPASLIKFEPTYEGGAKHVGDTLTIEDFDFEDKVLFNDGKSHLSDEDVSLEIKSGAKLETTSNTVVVAIKRGGTEVGTKTFTIAATMQYGATLDVNIAGSVDADLSAKVEEGETFVGSVLPTEHYNIDSVVVNDSTGATVASNYNTSTGVLTVENVADNLTVVVTTSPKGVVTSLLENGVAATHYQLTDETGAVYGGTYEATLSAINQDTVKYDISSVVVTNNGVTVTGAYDETTGKIKVEGVNGAIVVSVTCTDHKYTASLDAESEHVALVNTSEIAYGTTYTTTFTVDDHYQIDSVSVTDSEGNTVSSTFSGGTLTVGNVTDDLTISVETSVITHRLSFDYDDTKIELSSEPETITELDTIKITISPKPGYKVNSVTVNGETATLEDGVLTLTGITANSTIVINEAEADPLAYTISHDENSHFTTGSEQYSGQIGYGGSLVETIVADEGYRVDETCISVTNEDGNVAFSFVDGELTVTGVTKDITVTVEPIQTFNISLPEGDYFDTDADKDVIDYNSSVQVEILVDDHYHVTSLGYTIGGGSFVDLTKSVVLDDGYYTFAITNVTGDVNVTLVVAIDTFSVEATGDDNVDVTFNATSPVAYGTDVTFTVTPDEEYNIATVEYKMGDDDWESVALNVNNQFTLYVTGDVQVRATSTIKTFDIILPDFDNFVINAIPTQVDYNGSTNVAFSVDEHYHVTLLGYTIGGGSFIDITDKVVLVNNCYQFQITGITGDVKVTLTVAIDTYKVTTTPDANSYIDVDTSVAHGDDLVVEVGANEHYHLVSITYTIEGEAEAHTVDIEDLVEGKFIIKEVKGNVVVTASSEHDECNVSYVKDDHSNVVGSLTVEYGGRLEFEVSKDNHYNVDIIAEKKGGGEYLVQFDSEKGVYYIENVTVDVKIIVTSKIETNNVTYHTDDLSINYDGPNEVNYGEKLVISDISTSEHHHVVVSYKMDGMEEAQVVEVIDGVVTIENVTGPIHVYFSNQIDTVNVTVNGEHYSAEETIENVDYGGTYTNTFTATSGYIVVSVTYQIGVEEPVTVTGNTVTINNVTAALVITVNTEEVTVTGITVVPTEINVEFGEDVNLNSLVVTATYSDGTSKTVTDFTVTGYNKNVAGEYDATVEYSEGDKTVSCNLKVTVKESEEIDHIEVSTEKTVVDYGGTFTKEDVKVTYVYTDGHRVENKPAESISGFEATTIGEQTITVTAAGKTATLTITVNGHVVTSLDVTGYDEYVDQGKEYVFNGKVVAHYADETSEEVTGYTVSKVNTEEHGAQKATVSFGGVSVTITVNVIQTKTPVEPYQAVAIGGGAVVGVAIIAAGLFFFLKKFKI